MNADALVDASSLELDLDRRLYLIWFQARVIVILGFTPGLVFIIFWFRRYISTKQPFMPIMIERISIAGMKFENVIYFDTIIAIEVRIGSLEHICISLNITVVLRFNGPPH